ncbi:thioredoxin [Romboutsia maritimum]|uniref:Thioredoxin n=1 Tax=Romboutsia maritimum TaxID=2020948 RepID=A0A371IVI3_9FIRM|nr:thioredoxin domain-containing protein [Romboutsia maritimum]RDY24490.1 thioredoxin [Romboutsia maritimum]
MVSVDKDTFEREVLSSEGVVAVDFLSQACEPCKNLLPEVEKLADKYKGKIKFCKLDTTRAKRLAITQKVLGLPTVAIYKNGEKIDEVTKEDATIQNIENMIEKYI